MKNVVGVKFRPEGKVYTFASGDLPLKKHDQVIAHTDNGPAICTVATEVRAEPIYKLPVHLKSILRKATDGDLKMKEDNQRLEMDARRYCRERIVDRKLPMKLIDVESSFDRSKIVFNFTAENRVDFRDLVKDLVQKFRTRIELRQIGARQEAKIVKGLGICGREVCCATMLSGIDRVSIKMAKEQGMSLNPEKISGLCGRLMCCLSYEFEGYMEMKRGMPKCGKTINISSGCARVLRQNVLRGEIVVSLENGKETTINVKDL